MSDVAQARSILARMLELEFGGAAEYRRQLLVAELTRHATGCRVVVDRSRAAAAPFDEGTPAARLPVAAYGHGKLVVWLHGYEGFLDDLELLYAERFPDPATVRIDWA